MSQQWTPPPPPTATKIPNNMVIAIIATVVSVLFCCLPHGLVALIFAVQVDKKAAAGDVDGAMKASKQAKLWGLVSIIVAVVGGVLGFAFGFFALVWSAFSR